MSATALALLGGAGKAVSTWYTNRKAEKSQHEAQDFSAQQYATRYQTQAADMKKAGLNPMLAFSQSPGSAPQGQAAPVKEPEIAETAMAAGNYSADMLKKKYEASNLEKTGFNLDGMWYTIANEIKKSQNEIDRLEQLIKNDKATENEINMHKDLLEKQKFFVETQTKLIQQQVNIGKPEEAASATQAAYIAAEVQKVLQPIIDALGGVSKVRKPR